MESNAPVGFRITPRLLIGLAIVGFGLLWMLDNFGYLVLDDYVVWWPVVFILIGVARLFDPSAGRFASVILIGVGAVLLGFNLDLLDFNIVDLIPVVIILIGLRVAWSAFRGWDRTARLDGDPNATTNAFAMLSGVKKRITSAEYRGGEATAILGGVEIDLRGASPKDGQAVLDIFALMGGVEITVPENWTVDQRLVAIMGGFEDKTRPPREIGPRLVVKGMAMMGGVEVKN